MPVTNLPTYGRDLYRISMPGRTLQRLLLPLLILGLGAREEENYTIRGLQMRRCVNFLCRSCHGYIAFNLAIIKIPFAI